MPFDASVLISDSRLAFCKGNMKFLLFLQKKCYKKNRKTLMHKMCIRDRLNLTPALFIRSERNTSSRFRATQKVRIVSSFGWHLPLLNFVIVVEPSPERSISCSEVM